MQQHDQAGVRRHRVGGALGAGAWVLGALCVFAGCNRGGAGSAGTAGAPAVSAESSAGARRGPVRVTTTAATARQLADTLAASGSLVADQQSALTPIVPGRVMAVMIERGQRVTEGQPLLRVRDTDYRTQAVSAQAAVAQARARLGLDQPGAGTFRAEETAEVRAAAAQRDMAEDGLRRAEQLHRSGAMSDADYQRATMQATAAREQHRAALNGVRGAYYGYQQAREALSAAQRAVADSIVRAPFAGEIAERMCNVGEYVSPQRAILTLVRTDPLRLELQVPQERIAGVRQGQAVEVRVDAFPERVFRGTVQYISAAVRPDSRSLVAEAVVPNTEGLLRPGMFASGRIDLGARRPAVVVPARAIVTEAGVNRVYIVVDGRAAERVVQVVDRSEGVAVIDRGLNPGDQVAVDGVADLYDGAVVVTGAAPAAAAAPAAPAVLAAPGAAQ